MHSTHRRRLILFIVVGAVLFYLSSRVGILRLYQGSTASYIARTTDIPETVPRWQHGLKWSTRQYFTS
jgi:hypothetical protein